MAKATLRVVVRDFKCPECGTVQQYPKKKSRRTNCGHIKTAYCYSCKKVVQFEQIGTK